MIIFLAQISEKGLIKTSFTCPSSVSGSQTYGIFLFLSKETFRDGFISAISESGSESFCLFQKSEKNSALSGHHRASKEFTTNTFFSSFSSFSIPNSPRSQSSVPASIISASFSSRFFVLMTLSIVSTISCWTSRRGRGILKDESKSVQIQD